MIALNKHASLIARRFPVHACSDVTGFGLLGHAAEMAMGSGVTLVLDSAALPVLPGAARLGESRPSHRRMQEEPRVPRGQGRREAVGRASV